jgi:metal-responsive CopG/Arc/MetJ family transcriptional regulator
MGESEVKEQSPKKETSASTSFTLTVSLISWLEEETERRGMKSRSLLLREIIEGYRAESAIAA